MEEKKDNIRYIVRIAGKDLDGSLPIERSLTAIKGVSQRMAKNVAIAFEKKTGVLLETPIGKLTDEQDKTLENVLLNPKANNIPTWTYNRQRDLETGENIHLVTNELEFSKRQDLQRLSEIKSYRGLRNAWGLTVRGQRTRSTHRGKGGVVGVLKKDAKAAAKASSKSDEDSKSVEKKK